MVNSHELNEQNRARLEAQEKAERYRFQEQCFLSFWKAHIFKSLWYSSTAIAAGQPAGRRRRIYQGMGAPEFDPWETPAAWGANTNPLAGSSVYHYEHINTIDAKQPAQVVSMFNQKDGADLFFRLDSSVLTQLKPIVEFHKIYPASTRQNQEGVTPLSPIRPQAAMPLGENIRAADEGMPSSRKDLSSIEDLFYDHDVLGNVMLTDLNFKFAGQNVALLNTVEEVSFTLSFSSFNLFTHEFETKFEDGSSGGRDLRWSYQDLISYSTRYLQKDSESERASTKIDSPEIQQASCYENAETFVGPPATAELEENLNEDYFEIQMSVRYDPNDINWDMIDLASAGSEGGRLKLNLEERDALKSFLRNSAIILRLQFVAHTIRYNSKSSGADPELLIDFEYKAFVESSLNSADLDLFKLSGEQNRNLAEWEMRLSKARELLFAVQRERLTLGAIFGEHGELDTNLNKQYQQLRGDLDLNPADVADGGVAELSLSWLIWSPVVADNQSQTYAAWAGGIIPTPEDFEGNRETNPHYRQIRRGLRYDPENLETVLGSTANAILVFQELVDKLMAYIKRIRRQALQKKYQKLFEMLYASERVYSVEVELAELGGANQDTRTSESEMASSRRAQLQERGNLVSLVPATSVKIVRDLDTTGRPTTGDSVQDMLDKFAELNMGGMENSMSDQQLTLAQELQKQFGDPDGPFSSATTDGSKGVVYFTNLGDIVDTAITVASYPDYGLFKRRIGMLFGPLLEKDNSATIDGTHYLFNLAWVPISLKALLGFFAMKVLASGKERYLLNDFIKDLIGNLILPALGSRCVEDAQQGNQQIGTITFTSEMQTIEGLEDQYKRKIPPFYPQHGPPWGFGIEDDYPPGGSTSYIVYGNQKVATDQWEWIKWGNGSIKKLTEVSPNTPLDEQYHYMFIYINNISPIHLDPIEEEKNIDNGVYYLHLGQIPSIVKQSTFRKENIPYMREARAMSQLTRTGGIALRDVYRFQCTMYGNNIFKPGMLFFVDPTKDGALTFDSWKDLGLVGFFRVISVNHQVNVGMTPIHETQLEAKWETFGNCGDKEGLINTEFGSIAVWPSLEKVNASSDGGL